MDAIKAAPSRYILKKRTAYLMAFAQYVKQKVDKQPIQKPTIDAKCLSTALLQLTQFVQNECFGSVFKSLSENFPDSLEKIIKQLTSQHALSEAEQKISQTCDLCNA